VKVIKSNFFPILVSTSIRTGGLGRCGRGFTREGGEKVKDHLIVDFEVGDPKMMCGRRKNYMKLVKSLQQHLRSINYTIPARPQEPETMPTK
jgi:hypothetical protein